MSARQYVWFVAAFTIALANLIWLAIPAGADDRECPQGWTDTSVGTTSTTPDRPPQPASTPNNRTVTSCSTRHMTISASCTT